jgi:Stigma-specific protein, Stig1/Putative metal-binding motif
VCVDTKVDPSNCGACDNACPAGQACDNGSCSWGCTGGTTKCGAKCVDTLLDPANCGGCNKVCPAGEVCSLGSCGLICGGGTTKCGAKCVDTKSDPANCGGCGTKCATGQLCSGGSCGGSCSGTQVMCGNKCVDTQTDPANCGSCGTVCVLGTECKAGKCVACNSSTTDCDKDGWLLSEGDCCDKPGLCGAEPAKVNPGAIEVVGNGIDDNCNGKADLLDGVDTLPCDTSLASDSVSPLDFAKALGICRTTKENPASKKDKTWGLIGAQLLRADGSALGSEHRGHSLREKFGKSINPLEGKRLVVLSSGIAADGAQTKPGPNGGAPAGSNVSTSQSNSANIQTCSGQFCVDDWFATANPPLKAANALPVAPSCGSGTAGQPQLARDSIMLVLRLRAPTNAAAFSFNSYFFSAEYPEYVCTQYNDQIISLVDTPAGKPTIPNPVDKNLMTYNKGTQRWPIGINIAKGTSLFSVCETQTTSPSCWDNDVSSSSCSLGAAQLSGTGFDKKGSCLIGGGSYWLTTAGNVIPGQLVEIRIAIWDVGDNIFDSLVLLDGFRWSANATLPGTG